MEDGNPLTHGMTDEKRAQFFSAVERVQAAIDSGHMEHPSTRQERKRALRAQFQNAVASTAMPMAEAPAEVPPPPTQALPQWQVRSQ